MQLTAETEEGSVLAAAWKGGVAEGWGKEVKVNWGGASQQWSLKVVACHWNSDLTLTLTLTLKVLTCHGGSDISWGAAYTPGIAAEAVLCQLMLHGAVVEKALRSEGALMVLSDSSESSSEDEAMEREEHEEAHSSSDEDGSDACKLPPLQDSSPLNPRCTSGCLPLKSSLHFRMPPPKSSLHFRMPPPKSSLHFRMPPT